MATSASITPTGPIRSARRTQRQGKPYAKNRSTTMAGKEPSSTIEQEQSFLRSIASGVTSLFSRTINSAFNTLFSEDLPHPTRHQKQQSFADKEEQMPVGAPEAVQKKKQSLMRPELAPHFVGQTPWVVRQSRGHIPKSLEGNRNHGVKNTFKKMSSMSDFKEHLPKKKSFQITAETHARRDSETLKWLSSHHLSLQSLLSDKTPPFERHADLERFRNLRLDTDFLARQGLDPQSLKSKQNGVSKEESTHLIPPPASSHHIPPPDLTDPRLHLDPIEWPRTTGPQILAAWKEVCRRWEIICREEKNRNQFGQSDNRHRRSASALPILIKPAAPTEEGGKVSPPQERRKRNRQISNESPPRKRKTGSQPLSRARRATSEVPTSSKVVEAPKRKTRRQTGTLLLPPPCQVEETAKENGSAGLNSSNLAPIADTMSAPPTSRKAVPLFDLAMIPEARKKRPGFFSAREEDLEEMFGPMQDIEMENEHPRKKAKTILSDNVAEPTISKGLDKARAKEVDMSWENTFHSQSNFGFKPRVPALRDSEAPASSNFGTTKDVSEGQQESVLSEEKQKSSPPVQFTSSSVETSRVPDVPKAEDMPSAAPTQAEESPFTSEPVKSLPVDTGPQPDTQKESELPLFVFGATKSDAPIGEKNEKLSYSTAANSSVPPLDNTKEPKDALPLFTFGTTTKKSPITNGFSFKPSTASEEIPKAQSPSFGIQQPTNGTAVTSTSAGGTVSEAPKPVFSFDPPKQLDNSSGTAAPFNFMKPSTPDFPAVASFVAEKPSSTLALTAPPTGPSSLGFNLSNTTKQEDSTTQVAFGDAQNPSPGNTGEADMDMDGQNHGINEPTKPSGFSFGATVKADARPPTTNGLTWGTSAMEKKDEAPKSTAFSFGTASAFPQSPFGAPGATTQVDQANGTKKPFVFGSTSSEAPKPSFPFGSSDAPKTMNTNTFPFGNAATTTENKSDFSFGTNNFGSNSSVSFGQPPNNQQTNGIKHESSTLPNSGFVFNFGGGSAPPVFGAPQQQQAAPPQLNFNAVPSFNFGASSGFSNQPTTPISGQSTTPFVFGAGSGPVTGGFNIGTAGNAAASPGGRKIAPMKSRKGRR